MEPENPDDKSKKMIPKSRLDEVIAQREEFKKLLEVANTQLEELKTVDPKQLQTTIEQLQKTNQEKEAELTSRINDLIVKNAITAKIASEVYDVDLVIAKLDTSSIDAKTVDKLDDQIESLRKSHGFLFKESEPEQAPQPKLLSHKPPNTNTDPQKAPSAGADDLGSILGKEALDNAKTSAASAPIFFK